MENALFSEARSLQTTAGFESRTGRPLLKETSFHYSHLRKAAKPRLFNSLAVVTVVSLTFLYLIFRCFQHFSNNPSLGVQLRALASGGDGDYYSCFGWQGGEDSSDDVSGEEEEPSGDTSDPSADTAERGATGRHDVQGEAGRDSAAFAKGWGPWQIPFEWQDQLEALLVRLTAAAAQCMELLPRLDPMQSVSLARSLSYLAVLELSGFAYIPPRIQPVREQAGEAYVQLLESILTNRAAANLIARSKAQGNVECLQRLLGIVSSRPERELQLSRASFKASFICHWKVCSYSVQLVEGALSSLLAQSDQQLGVSPHETENATRLFRALFAVRKKQVLRRPLTKNWLVVCQEKLGVFLLFTKSEFRKHSSEAKQRAAGMLEEIVHAVEHEGGTRFTVAAAQTFLPAAPPISEGYIQDVATAQGLRTSIGRFHRSPSDASSEQSSALPSSISYYRIPSDAGYGQTQPGTQPPQFPQASTQATAQPQKISSAPPEAEATSSGSDAFEVQPEARPRAWYVANRQGWGTRRMPQKWAANLVHMMNKMNTVAVRCVLVIPSLHPEDGVLLAMHLASMAVVEVAAFGYVPNSMQPKRAEVGASYVRLIDQILAAGSSTLRAAETLSLRDRLLSLRLLLCEVSLEPPPVDVIDPSAYRRKICVQYMVSRYAFQRALDLLDSLLPGDVEKRTHVHNPKQVVEACANIVDVLRIHLFGNSFLRIWFNACQKRVAPFLLMTKAEYRELGQLRMKKTEEVLYDIEDAVRKAGCSLAPIHFGDDLSPRESSLDQDTEKQISVGGVLRPPPQVFEHSIQVAKPSDVSLTPGVSVRPPLRLPSPMPPYPLVGEQSASSLQASAPFRMSESRPAQHVHASSAPSLPSLVREFSPSSAGLHAPRSPAIQQISYPASPSSKPPALVVSSPGVGPSPKPSVPVPYGLMTRSSHVSSEPSHQTAPSIPTAPAAIAVPPPHAFGQPSQQGLPFQVWRGASSDLAAFTMPPSHGQPQLLSLPLPRQRSTPSATFARFPFPSGPFPFSGPAAFMVPSLHAQPLQLSVPLTHQGSIPPTAGFRTLPLPGGPGPSLDPAAFMVPPRHGQSSELPLPHSLGGSTPLPADSARSSSWTQAGPSLSSDTAALMVPPSSGSGLSSSRSLLPHRTRASSSAEPRSHPFQPASSANPPLPLRLPQEPSIWAALPHERARTEVRSKRASLPSAVPGAGSSPQALEETSLGTPSLQYGTETGIQVPLHGEENVTEKMLLPQKSIGSSGASGAVVETTDQGLRGLETRFSGWSLSDLAEEEEDS